MAITLKQYNHEKDSITIGFMPQYKYCSRAGVKAWEKHDIEGIYIMAKSKDEAKNYNNVLREGADYYIPTEQEDQVLFIRVSKRITPKLYKLKDGEMYILFSFPPFLFDSDEGMMEIKGNKGIFYKKPAL